MPEEDIVHRCLNLEWAFGLNKDFKGVVHNLSDGTRKAIFYVVAHVGVLYDVTKHQQRLLQGHRNPIIASCCSASRRFVITADAGDDAVMIVWDTYSCLPIKSLPVAAYGGVLACDVSADATYLVSISKDSPQTISLWAWTAEQETPEYTTQITSHDEQNVVRFNPDDPKLVLTNGSKRVIFWSWAEGAWKFFSPPVTSRELKQNVGNFTQSLFVPGTTMACSGTVDGDVILWDNARTDKLCKPTDKTLLKVVKIHNGGVTFLSYVKGYIVTGGLEGYVRFLDTKLRIVAWFEELNGGPVISISFDKSTAAAGDSSTANATATLGATGGKEDAAAQFVCPDFVVSTANAMIIDVPSASFNSTDAELQRGKLLVQGQDQPIMAIASHPSLPRLAIAGYSGNLHLWEYSTRKVLLLSIFRNLLVHSLAFDPKALYLGVGFTNGVVKVLDANSLEEMQSFRPKTPDCITTITFSHDSHFFATADSEGCVGLYKFTHRAQDPRKPIEWVYIGRHRSHRAAVTGLQFGIVPYGDAPRLISLGEDKRLAEYNLVDSDVESGLRVRCVHKVTQGAVPTCLFWTQEQLLHDKSMPRPRDGKAPASIDTLVIATNEYKLKLHATDMSRQCLKTVLGPTFGGPLNKIVLVPGQSGSQHRALVYSTHQKIVGLVKVPLDGNPRGSMGLLAHPLEISNMCVSHDGKYLFTAGGRDHSVLQWAIDAECLVTDDGRNVVEHYIDVIEGGREGDFMKEIVDYFYYAQIRAQGEETTAKRKIIGTIPFSQVPNLMRALGFYPSEKEVQHMTFEIDTQFGKVGSAVEDITINFETFVRLYVNHRPVFGINKSNIEAAFAAIGADPTTGLIDRDVLFNLISTRGEALHSYEVESALKSLLGDDVQMDMLEDKITAKAFAENLLGFEDYDDGQGLGEQPAAAGGDAEGADDDAPF